jgi:adenylosuccinate lyase
MHELIRERSMQAWQAVQASTSTGVPANPLPQLLSQDEHVKEYLPEAKVLALFDARGHVGDAPARARAMAAKVLGTLAESKTGDQA